MNLDFDFLIDPPPTEKTVRDTKPIKMNKRMLVQYVLEVLVEEGGKEWLRTQMRSDPRNYMELVKKLIPTQSAFDEMSDIQINLINRFGEQVQISAKGNTYHNQDAMLPPPSATGEHEPGQLEIATSGNPHPAEQVRVIERYDDRD